MVSHGALHVQNVYDCEHLQYFSSMLTYKMKVEVQSSLLALEIVVVKTILLHGLFSTVPW